MSRALPASSQLALFDRAVQRSIVSQRAAVLRAMHQRPAEALTSLELSHLSEIDRYTVARRLPELARMGLVRRCEHLGHCRISGHKAVRWRLVASHGGAK